MRICTGIEILLVSSLDFVGAPYVVRLQNLYSQKKSDLSAKERSEITRSEATSLFETLRGVGNCLMRIQNPREARDFDKLKNFVGRLCDF